MCDCTGGNTSSVDRREMAGESDFMWSISSFQLPSEKDELRPKWEKLMNRVSVVHPSAKERFSPNCLKHNIHF